MTDKLRKTFPLKITFGQGEQPTGAKLSAISEQTRNGLGLVEAAVGDVWNHSGDNILVDYPLQIPNLARLLGQNQFLNPALYPAEEEFTFRERIDTKFADQTTGYLTFKPKTGTTPIGSGDGIDDGVFVVSETDEWEVGRGSALAYWVSDETGKFRTDVEVGTGVSSEDYLTYYVEPDVDWFARAENFPGVIPDFRQTEFTSCRIEQVGDRFFLHLPPRMPLDFDILGYELPQSEPIKYPASEDVANTYNRATTIATPFKLWQATGINALAHQHYRYSLPKEIREAHGSLAAGAEYPSGFMWLWDKTLGHILDGIIFKKPEVTYVNDTWVIQISSDTVDLSAYVSSPSNESEASYNFSNIVLITCGSPVARSVWSLFTAAMNHTHSNEGHQSAILSHKNLLHIDPPIAINNEHSARYPTYLPRWSASAWNNDDHVSLLSRGGSQGTSDSRRRDLNDNAMLGHLVLADQDDGGTGIFLDDTPENTWRLYFGAVGGPSLYASSGDGINLPDRLYLGDHNDGYLVGASGRPFLNSPTETMLLLKSDLHATTWSIHTNSSIGSMYISNDEGGDRSLAFSPDRTVWIGKGAEGFATDRQETLIVRNTDRPQIHLFDGGSDTKGAALFSWSSGDAYFTNANNFRDNGTSGNSWMNIGGQSGVQLRYGNAGTSKEGTIGAFLNNSGSFYIADSNSFSLTNTSLGIDADGKGSTWRALNAQNPSLAAGQIIQLNFGESDTNGNTAELGFVWQGNDSGSNALRLGFHTNSDVVTVFNDNHVSFKGNVDILDGIDVTGLLSVTGGVRARGGAPGASGANNNGYAFNSPGDNDSGMYSEADGDLRLYTNNVERIRITNKIETFGGVSSGFNLDCSAVTSGYTGSIVLNDTGMFIRNSSDSRPIYFATNRGNALIINTDAANDMLMYSEMSADRELGHTDYPWTNIYIANPDDFIIPGGSSYYETSKKMFANNGAVYSISGLSSSFSTNPGSYSYQAIRIYGTGSGNATLVTTLPGPNARGRFGRAGVTHYSPTDGGGLAYFYMKIWYREYDAAVMYQLGSTSSARYVDSSVSSDFHDADAGYANADALYYLEIDFNVPAGNTISTYFLAATAGFLMYGFPCGVNNA